MNTILLNASCCLDSVCLLCPTEFSWLWFAISIIAVFLFGLGWYNMFTARWIKAINYGLCACGADLAKGEKCTCKPSLKSFLPMFFQLVATILIGYMYFILAPISICLAIFVGIAVMSWTKSNIIFATFPNNRKSIDRILIEVGYFAISSAIFIFLALI
ncbi:MAG: hypothetical protein LBU91_05245 [Bacteroidales bacterium]|jgi:hypothetical protein|nr:hypothetical protein [Bacteroidales bacterium]